MFESKHYPSRFWKTAAMAGGAAIALPSAAQATIVYSGIQNITATTNCCGAPASSNAVNVNLDGLLDHFELEVNNPNSLNAFSVYANPLGTSLIMQSPGLATALNFGDTIDGSGMSADPAALDSKLFGGWHDGNPHYMGIQFSHNSTDVLGWVQIQRVFDPTNLNAIAIDWAYEDSGAAIAAGNTGVPEPSSFGLMALGAAGLAALRRRRAKV